MSNEKLNTTASAEAGQLGSSEGSAPDFDECCACRKPQSYRGEHAECIDCGATICDSCLVAGVDVPGWHNGDFRCPDCAAALLPNTELTGPQGPV